MYTQTQIDELRSAIASGALTVKHGDKMVTYRSIDEMRAVLAEMTASVSNTTQKKVGFVRYSRGL